MEKSANRPAPFNLANTVNYEDGGIVSKQILKNPSGNITVFSFAKGEGLSRHTAPFDAAVQILDGTAEITVGDTPHTLKSGDFLIMPANVPHELRATQNFKMLLTMIRG